MFNKDGRSIAKGACHGTRGSAVVGKHDRWYSTVGPCGQRMEICRVHGRRRTVIIVTPFSTLGGAGD